MQAIEINASERDLKTKGDLRQLRLKGLVPAVVYGARKAPASLSVDGKEFLGLLKSHGANVVVNLKVGAGAETVLVKEVQRDPIGHHVMHVDFQRISLTETIEVSVPVRVKGEAPGVKLAGGILEHILREVRVRCLPLAIPAALDVDVSALEINQGLKVKDIRVPAGLELLTDREQLVINIVAPSELEEPEPAAAAAAAPGAAEPEVIAKGKKPEEGEEGAAAPAAGAKPAAGGKPAAAPAKEAKVPAGKEGK